VGHLSCPCYLAVGLRVTLGAPCRGGCKRLRWCLVGIDEPIRLDRSSRLVPVLDPLKVQSPHGQTCLSVAPGFDKQTCLPLAGGWQAFVRPARLRSNSFNDLKRHPREVGEPSEPKSPTPSNVSGGYVLSITLFDQFRDLWSIFDETSKMHRRTHQSSLRQHAGILFEADGTRVLASRPDWTISGGERRGTSRHCRGSSVPFCSRGR
jgi:hypothetical protein